ncbi:MAG: GyrI-like domain-containing protein [Gammaproteobacteria bacterium]|nr:GyrI-like domain-containing protein [Gammaproteobacteria bacterium]
MSATSGRTPPPGPGCHQWPSNCGRIYGQDRSSSFITSRKPLSSELKGRSRSGGITPSLNMGSARARARLAWMSAGFTRFVLGCRRREWRDGSHAARVRNGDCWPKSPPSRAGDNPPFRCPCPGPRYPQDTSSPTGETTHPLAERKHARHAQASVFSGFRQPAARCGLQASPGRVRLRAFLRKLTGQAMSDVQIEEVELAAQPAMVVRRTVDVMRMGEAFADIFPRVAQHIIGSGQAPAGMPFARYFHMDGTHCQLAAGMPVASALAGSDDIEAHELPAGRALTALHVGPYEGVGAVWQQVWARAREMGSEAQFGGWDVYANDPGEVPEEKLETRIYLPLGR